MTIAVMLVTILSGPMEGTKFTVPFETIEQCLGAKSAISDTLVYDHNMQCSEAQF